MSEEWRPVLGYEGSYEVSDLGRVRSLTRKITNRCGVTRTWPGQIINPAVDDEGRLQIRLHMHRKSTVRRVHRMVLESFVGPRPEGMEGCHGNGDASDNRLENLRWDTKSGNQLDSVRHGTHFRASQKVCSQGHPLDGYRGGARYCKTCNRARQRPRQRAAYVPRAELPVCPGSGQPTKRERIAAKSGRCPLCNLGVRVRVDGTTGIHPPRAARERRTGAGR